MKIYFMSQEYEFAQICSRLVAVYLRLHLKICTLQTRYKKCSVQIDLPFYVFTHKYTPEKNTPHMLTLSFIVISITISYAAVFQKRDLRSRGWSQ